MGAGHFRILSKDNALPLVAFSLTKTVNKEGKQEARQYTEFDLADKLRQRGWVLPAYTMAPDARQAQCCQDCSDTTSFEMYTFNLLWAGNPSSALLLIS